MRCLLASISVVVLLAAPVRAQTASTPAKGALNEQDRSFIDQAAAGGLAEVAAGKIAEQKAQKEAVKNFARQMITDHTAANHQLTQIASEESVKVPTTPDEMHSAEAARMNKLSGADFDDAYMQQQVKDHQTTIQLFQKEASSGQDTKLKTFAAETLPILQHHLQMAQSIAGE